ncbi:MAG TPA: anion permease [Candidatus Choladousia intestinavium]|uniref:Anion permease n=1 Tax=Candidatus Choladousia intestinavium TaxID=2840727 RepID=A0A9D1ABQ1_9FIRM|nr:anion permease [Candidatus Choladousia intestinavium]
MKKNRRLLNLILGPLLLLACIFFLPESLFAGLAGRAAVGTVAWMAFWWVTAPVDYAVTAFLPIAVNAVIQMADMESVIANYASETILLLLGASILTVSWERTGLDKRIALRFLNLIGSGLRKQIVFWFLVSAVLSAVLPNAVVCATVTPIAVSMLNYIGEKDVASSKTASKILLTIAYAAGVGGLATPLGGAMNLVVVDYIQQLTGEEYMYIEWVIKFLPIMIVLVVSNLLFLVRDIGRKEELGGSAEYFARELKNMPPMNVEEAMSLALFLLATLLSFTRQFYQDMLPGLKPAYVFIICAVISFLIVDKDGNRLLVWKSVQSKIIWELIYIFAGGLAAGTLINDSGAAEAIGQMVSGMGLEGGIATVFVIVLLTLALSDVTSNTATAAVSIPIVISIMQGIGLDPLPYVYVATIGINLSYTLPTSIRAIPVGYGLQPSYMMKEGLKLSAIVLVLMTACGYALFVL